MKKVNVDLMLGKKTRSHFRHYGPKTTIVAAEMPVEIAIKTSTYGLRFGKSGLNSTEICDKFNIQSPKFGFSLNVFGRLTTKTVYQKKKRESINLRFGINHVNLSIFKINAQKPNYFSYKALIFMLRTLGKPKNIDIVKTDILKRTLPTQFVREKSTKTSKKEILKAKTQVPERDWCVFKGKKNTALALKNNDHPFTFPVIFNGKIVFTSLTSDKFAYKKLLDVVLQIKLNGKQQLNPDKDQYALISKSSATGISSLISRKETKDSLFMHKLKKNDSKLLTTAINTGYVPKKALVYKSNEWDTLKKFELPVKNHNPERENNNAFSGLFMEHLKPENAAFNGNGKYPKTVISEKIENSEEKKKNENQKTKKKLREHDDDRKRFKTRQEKRDQRLARKQKKNTREQREEEYKQKLEKKAVTKFGGQEVHHRQRGSKGNLGHPKNINNANNDDI